MAQDPIYRITLDGNILSDEPEGQQDFISELRRDKQIRGQLLLLDITLKFKGGTDGYEHLKPLIDCQGFCDFSEVQIDEDCNQDGNWVQIFDGLLFYTLVKEHLFPCLLECQLKDNSYAAKIDNNKNIEAFVTVGRSKNDEEIIVADSNIISVFDVTTGVYGGSRITVWPVYGCFKFIIHYMTDGEIDFASDYFFGNLLSGDGRFMTITTGEQIRLGTGGAPTIVPFISLQKLFEEVNKKVRIAFNIEVNPLTGRKQMRIEPESYFFNTGVSTTLNNVKGIVKSVNTAELYSRLKIGSSETLAFDSGITDFPTDIRFAGFKEESHTMTGKCNIDNTLDLVSDWIIDSNVIQSILSGNDGYDEDIVFVMADYITDPLNQVAIQTDVFSAGGPPLFYNDFLRNANVAQRWLGGIPNSIALYLGNGNDEFRAEGLTQIPASAPGTLLDVPSGGFTEPLSFQDDFTSPNFDTNGNYNNISFRYIAPATGLFTFFSSIPFKIFPVSSFGYHIRGFFRVYDAASALLSTFEFATTGFVFPPGPAEINITIAGSQLIYLNAGEYVVVAYKAQTAIVPPLNPVFTSRYFVMPGRIFACESTSTGGGVFQTYNPEDFKAYQYNFNDYPLTFAQYRAIIANPLKLLGFNDLNGWIENMKYLHKEGTADFVLTKQLPKTICE